MANLTTTVTSLLSTIDTTATTLTNTIGTASRSISMLDAYVKEQQKKQAIRITIDEENYEHEMLTKAAERMAKEEKRIQRELDSDPELMQMFKSNYTKLQTALAAKKSTL
ncbi:hypothetical protein [Rhizobium phage RHph_X2_28B]|uniref:hypothetical protein n=1 Tax=Rhizobium phage RHph_X2_28B TaxID=2836086 RepID=UPI0023295304|nr:hypothetical protein PP751_gp001 [Rhizobium phage RHph_X2_28B]QWY83453.1 hypothetical protein [Rhizobium phage RHph_X2_28B]QWY83689.1 hypothetical protein [Rhizobium phage RHph_X3_15]